MMHVVNWSQHISDDLADFRLSEFESVYPFVIKRSSGIGLVDDIEAVGIVIVLHNFQRIWVVLVL